MAKKKAARKTTRLPREGTTERYRAENDLQTLKTAEEIHADAKRFAQAKKIGVKQVDAIKKVLVKKKG